MIQKNRSVFEVSDSRCNQCLFGPHKIVDNERRKQVLDHCQKEGIHFVCHKFSLVNRDVCCKGFFDAFPDYTPAMRLGRILELIRFVPIPSDEEVEEGLRKMHDMRHTSDNNVMAYDPDTDTTPRKG